MNSEQIFQIMSQILTDYLRLAPDEVTRNSHVVNDLGADSLALVELGFKMMEAFEVGMIEPRDELLIVGNLADHISALKAA